MWLRRKRTIAPADTGPDQTAIQMRSFPLVDMPELPCTHARPYDSDLSSYSIEQLTQMIDGLAWHLGCGSYEISLMPLYRKVRSKNAYDLEWARRREQHLREEYAREYPLWKRLNEEISARMTIPISGIQADAQRECLCREPYQKTGLERPV